MSGKPVDLVALRQEIANLVGSKSVEMVTTATQEVCKVGNVAALKYLFDLIGLHPPSGEPVEEADSNELAKVLLSRLNLNREVEVPDLTVEAYGGAGSDSVE